MTPEQKAKLHSEIGKGREVKALVENESFKQVLNDSLHGIQNAWLDAQTVEARESLWHQGAGLKAFADNLQSIINTGRMAEQQLEIEKRMEQQDGEAKSTGR